MALDNIFGCFLGRYPRLVWGAPLALGAGSGVAKRRGIFRWALFHGLKPYGYHRNVATRLPSDIEEKWVCAGAAFFPAGGSHHAGTCGVDGDLQSEADWGEVLMRIAD